MLGINVEPLRHFILLKTATPNFSGRNLFAYLRLVPAEMTARFIIAISALPQFSQKPNIDKLSRPGSSRRKVADVSTHYVMRRNEPLARRDIRTA